MNPVLRIAGLRKAFGANEVIQGLDLHLQAGERHGLIGPNGAGKSTLFNLVSGRDVPSAGLIELKGENIAGLKPHEICRRGLSRSFQITHLFPALSVYEHLRCAVLASLEGRYTLWQSSALRDEVRGRVAATLAEIGLTARREVAAGLLSYAEQRALEIGVTLAVGADMLLLDEPTAGMSRAESAQAVALIRRVARGRTLLVVEHDMEVVFALADRISVLVQGRIIATGAPEEIRANPAVQGAYLGVGLESGHA